MRRVFARSSFARPYHFLVIAFGLEVTASLFVFVEESFYVLVNDIQLQSYQD